MKKIIISALLILLAVSAGAQNKLERNFNEMSEEILTNLQTFFPVKASRRGVHQYDYLLPDYSSKAIKNEISKLKKFEQRLRKYRGTNLPDNYQIDLKLLKSEVDIALHDLYKLKWYTKNPYMYVETALDGIYTIMVSHHAPVEEKAQNINARLKVMPDLFFHARKNIKQPAPIYTDLALETIPELISFLETIRDELNGQIPLLKAEITANTKKAIESIREFRSFLMNVERGAATSFSMGKDDFDYRLKHQYFMDIDSDSLYKIGQTMMAWADSAYDSYLNHLDSISAGSDSLFIIDCVTKQDKLDYYAWEINQTKLFLTDNNILTIPEDIGDCHIAETPPFLRNVITSIAYHPPGSFNPDQTGYFYVRPILDTLDEGEREAFYRYIHRRGFKGAVVHEAYPGHHYQFLMAGRAGGDIRKWVMNACFYEGWALYCEQMMYDNGFYDGNERSYLRILGGIHYRAARIMADIKLHARGENPTDVLLWMAEQVEEDTSAIRSEINWYSLQPTVPMSYLTGKLEIMALREAMMKKQGNDFDLRKFHDRLHTEGSIPPALLWEIWGLTKE